MKLEQVIELYEYNNWANDKLLTFTGSWEPDNFHHNFSSSFGSIHSTFVHILGAEELWLSRWVGETDRQLLNSGDLPNYPSVKERWTVHKSHLNQFLSSLTEDKLVEDISYKNIKGVVYSLQLWKQLLHLSNHSSYHRGQIVTMIRQLDLQPPSTDLIYYYLGQR